MKGTEILKHEAIEFVKKGGLINIVNPQSMDEDQFKGKYLKIGGEPKLDLTRLDYLSLGSGQEIKDIMIESIKQCNISCPASQMVMKAQPNIRLERALAEFHGMRESIIFTTGYSANVNMMHALGLRMNTFYLAYYLEKMKGIESTRDIPTVFFLERESHFSLQHGVRIATLLAKDRCFMYKFSGRVNGQLDVKIKESFEAHGDNTVRIIVSDTLASVSGKTFDVRNFYETAEKHDCLLYLDEAHAIGVLGPRGRGVAASFGEFYKLKDNTIIMATLTKAFSQLGGYAVMSDTNLAWFLRACSPQYIFSAPVPPWMAEALIRIIHLIAGAFGTRERKKLTSVSEYMRNQLLNNDFNILGSNSHIIPVLIGDDAKSDQLKAFLEQRGFVASLFKYPAVPKGSSLIRFSLCSDIAEQEVDDIVKNLIIARERIHF